MNEVDLILLLIGALLICAALLFAWIKTKRIWIRITLILPILISLSFAVFAGLLLPLANRTQPANRQSSLAEGVEYSLRSLSQPRALVIHTVRIDLRIARGRFLVTPADSPGPLPLRARTVSTFAREFDLDLAIAGDFFAPWHYHNLVDYYPNEGDPVTSYGPASSGGRVYHRSPPSATIASLVIDARNRAKIYDDPPLDQDPEYMVSGQPLVREGRRHPLLAAGASYHEAIHPRAAVGLSADGQTMIWLIIDGRQPQFSEGVTISELAYLIIDRGAHTAINLDGGGSVALVWRDESGELRTLNSPVHGYPGNQRPVANHLGLRFRR